MPRHNQVEHRITFCSQNNFIRGQHSVRKSHVYDDINTNIYSHDEVLSHFPFRVNFESEKGIDAGGLARDALSGFWDKA